MNPLFFVLFNIAVAGFVGGITNHYAIKMLFHPRRKLYIGRWKVPFTPGLIPKRRDEIARALGLVVAEHLVTTEGLAGLLRKPEFRKTTEDKLWEFAEDWTSRNDTARDLLLRLWTPEQLDRGQERIFAWLDVKTRQSAEWLWDKQGLGQRTLGSLVPNWSGERREQLVQQAVALLVEAIRKELDTENGERMLRQMTSQFMEQAGGFLGALAGMFMDADKLVHKVKAALLQQLESDSLQQFAAAFIRGKLVEMEALTLEEAISKASGKDAKQLLADNVSAFADWRKWAEQLAGKKLSDIFGPHKEQLLSYIPGMTGTVLSLLADNMGRVVGAIQLPALVEEEVKKFPIEMLENIILSVSGKEFRAITWLGVLLGGVIGLLQSAIQLLSR